MTPQAGSWLIALTLLGVSVLIVDVASGEQGGSPCGDAPSVRGAQLLANAEQSGRDEDFELAGRCFMEAADRAPQAPEAPVFLREAGEAMELAGRLDTARALWQRFVDEYPEDASAEAARWHLAVSYQRSPHPEKAQQHLQILARTARDPDIRREATITAAEQLAKSGDYRGAARFYRQYANTGLAPDVVSRVDAAFLAAEMFYRLRDWSGTVTEMRRFLAEYRNVSEAGQHRVRAAYLVAEAFEAQGDVREQHRAFEEVITQFQGSGEPVGGSTAVYAAEARFKLVDLGFAALDGLSFKGPPQKIERALAESERQIKGLYDDLESVFRYRRPRWTLAAACRIGDVYAAPVEGVKRGRVQVERLSPAAREKIAAFEASATDAYQRCLEAAKTLAADDERTRRAKAWLAAHGAGAP